MDQEKAKEWCISCRPSSVCHANITTEASERGNKNPQLQWCTLVLVRLYGSQYSCYCCMKSQRC